MARGYRTVIAPLLLEQIRELGITDQVKEQIRTAMTDPEQAGKQLTGSFFPYRRLKFSRYRIIYRVARDLDPPEVRFLYAGIRKEGDKKDVYALLAKAMQRGGLERGSGAGADAVEDDG